MQEWIPILSLIILFLAFLENSFRFKIEYKYLVNRSRNEDLADANSENEDSVNRSGNEVLADVIRLNKDQVIIRRNEFIYEVVSIKKEEKPVSQNYEEKFQRVF